MGSTETADDNSSQGPEKRFAPWEQKARKEKEKP